MSDESFLGKQPGKGVSTHGVYRMASTIVARWNLAAGASVCDVGAGQGNFAKMLLGHFDRVLALDCEVRHVDPRISYFACDLNDSWPLQTSSLDGLVSLEVIEHVENPRHFFREIARVLKPGGRALITTPNQVSWASKLCLLARDQFQWFQDSCYPAHITALLPIDLLRIARETRVTAEAIHFSQQGRIPFSRLNWPHIFRGSRFSDNIGISFCRT